MASNQLRRLSQPSTQQRRLSHKAGFPAIEDAAFARLLPPHPTDSALEDMAKASAGFEGESQLYRLFVVVIYSLIVRAAFVIVALHRFVDYIPLVVDMELVRGVCQDLAPALRQSFKFSEPNLVERCREFCRNLLLSGEIASFLEQKLRRLARAEEELRNFWVHESPHDDYYNF
jgi:hypothetical protein